MDYNESINMVAVAESDSEYNNIEQKKIVSEQNSYFDEMGDEWITFSQAESRYGKSRSTIKRRTEDYGLEILKRDLSCGVTQFVRASDMERVISNDDLKAVTRAAKGKNFNTLMTNFLDEYESRIVAPLTSQLKMIGQAQTDMMSLQREMADKYEQLSKENAELKDMINNMSSNIGEQQGSARTEAKSEYDSLSVQNGELKEVISQLSERLEQEKTAEQNEAKAEYDKLSAENEELKKEIEQLNEKIGEQQAFIESEQEKAEKKKKGLFGFFKKDK